MNRDHDAQDCNYKFLIFHFNLLNETPHLHLDQSAGRPKRETESFANKSTT